MQRYPRVCKTGLPDQLRGVCKCAHLKPLIMGVGRLRSQRVFCSTTFSSDDDPEPTGGVIVTRPAHRTDECADHSAVYGTYWTLCMLAPQLYHVMKPHNRVVCVVQVQASCFASCCVPYMSGSITQQRKQQLDTVSKHRQRLHNTRPLMRFARLSLSEGRPSGVQRLCYGQKTQDSSGRRALYTYARLAAGKR